MSPAGHDLIVRADATTRMGTGHLMRSTALALGWRRCGRRPLIVTACRNPALLERIQTAGLPVLELEKDHPSTQDQETMATVLAASPDAWVVLDGYHFDAAYQDWVRSSHERLLVIDDTAHLSRYHARLLVNQNIHAPGLAYVCDADTHLLLGTKYAMLRTEFESWRDYRRAVPERARRILVSLGGSDPDNVSATVLRALAQLPHDEVEATLVIGGGNPHAEELRALAGDMPYTIHLRHNVSTMADLMAWADMAIAAAGSTCWELAYMGVPSLWLALADNQLPIAHGLEAAGFGVNLGWHGTLDGARLATELNQLRRSPARRRRMEQQGRKLVDGTGVARIIACMESCP